MTIDLDRYVVIKLITGQELIAQLVKEDDYDIKVQFPMMVKHISRNLNGFPVETLVLGTYSHFCSDDEFSFNKQHIIVLKDLDPRYIEEYHRAVDDFLGQIKDGPAYNPNEMEELSKKLKEMFKDKFDEDELVSPISIEGNKTLH